jgi:hypothetical protein
MTGKTLHLALGAFTAGIGADGRLRVTPSPPLMGNLPDALRHPTSVRSPAVRRGWLERRRRVLDVVINECRREA